MKRFAKGIAQLILIWLAIVASFGAAGAVLYLMGEAPVITHIGSFA
ncbi:hypothetical protein [Trinickia sp.]